VRAHTLLSAVADGGGGGGEIETLKFREAPFRTQNSFPKEKPTKFLDMGLP